MTDKRLLIAAGVLLLATGFAGYFVFFPRSSVVPDDQLQEIVYVDTKSGETFLLRARSSPEYHPETGDPTLIPGLYCEKCKKWRPVGSLEMLQTRSSPAICPQHKIPLTQDGPLPDTAE